MTPPEIFILGGALGGFIGGVVSASIARRQAKRNCLASTRRICLAEFKYWQDSGDVDGADETQQMIAMGAMGAASNILAGVTGNPADWHKPVGVAHATTAETMKS